MNSYYPHCIVKRKFGCKLFNNRYDFLFLRERSKRAISGSDLKREAIKLPIDLLHFLLFAL